MFLILKIILNDTSQGEGAIPDEYVAISLSSTAKKISIIIRVGLFGLVTTVVVHERCVIPWIRGRKGKNA